MNPKVLTATALITLGFVLFWPSGSSKKVERLYKDGEQLYSTENYEESIAKFEEALIESEKWGVKTAVIDKDFVTLAKYRISVCYSKLAEDTGDVNYFDQAVATIEEVWPNAKVPKHMEGLTYLWGHVLYKQEKYELAEPKFNELIENYPNSLFVENAWYALGQLNYKLQNYDACRQGFKQVLDGFPNSDFKDDAQHLIAQSFLDEQNYEQSAQEFDRLATEEFKNYPDLQAEAMYKAAYCLNQISRYEEAITRYTNFVTKFPTSKYVTAAYFDMGAVYARQKDYDNARVNYELAIQNTNDEDVQSEIQTAIGRTYYDEEDYANAIVAYTTLLENYPTSQFISEAKLGIADSHFKLSSWSEASVAYQRVLDEHADQSDLVPYVTFQMGEAHYKFATSLKETGQADSATENLEISLGWYQKAYNDYPTDPVAPHALYGAIWALNDLDRKEELEEVAREFIDKNREDPQLDILAAEVQLRFADMKFNDFKQYNEAAVEYARLWDKPDGDYESLPKFHLLKVIAKFQEGRSYYEVALEDSEGDSLDVDLLAKSINAYGQAIDKFNDESFLLGVEAGRYDDFPERTQQVEAAILNKALVHEKRDEWLIARELYEAIGENSDNYERSQLLIAQSYIEEGKISEAIDFYGTILDILSADNRSLAEIKLADLLRNEERFVEAANAYEQVVAGNPAGEYADDAQYLIGLCYYKAAEDDSSAFDKSITSFQKMINDYADSPNIVEAYYGIVLAFRDTDQWENVMSYADEASDNFSDSSEVNVLKTLGHIDLVKATAIENQGIDSEEDKQLLIASLQRIVGNTGAPPEARTRAQLKIGHLYYRDKDYSTAASEYQKVAQEFPGADPEILANSYYQTAVCYYQQAQSVEDSGAKNLALQNSASSADKVIELNHSVDSMISGYYTLGLAKFGLGDDEAAVVAYAKAISYEGETEDEARKDLIFQAHSRLAELYNSQEAYSYAVQEYQYITENTDDANLKGNSYFAMAIALDDHLSQYDDALLAYQNAIQAGAGAIVSAQSYYRVGLLYQQKLNDQEKALKAYETLVKDYSGEPDKSIQEMVGDASLRKSDLYQRLGRLEDAIAEAIETRDRAQLKSQKISAQYSLGSLYFDRARSLFSDEAGTELQPYIDASRESAAAYMAVYPLSLPVENLDKGLIPFLQNALFQSGQLYYSIGTSFKYKDELQKAIEPLQLFAKYVDQGYFASSPEVLESVEESLVYAGTAQFELGRLQLGEDEGVSEVVQGFFRSSADTFSSLAKRFPNAKDAATWQFQSGESYYASLAYERAVVEYDKVHKNYPKSESAPEALYAISTCYNMLADGAADEAESAKWSRKLFETNEVLAGKYPQSSYAGNAMVNLANKLYNEGSAPDIENSERIRLYKLAVEKYRAATEIGGIDAETKERAEQYVRETQNTLAYYIYTKAGDQLTTTRRAYSTGSPEEVEALESAIAVFHDLIKTYPNTKYADLAYVQIGEAYMVMADKEESYYANAIDTFDSLWKKYEVAPATDSQVSNAVKIAQRKISEIRAYLDGKQ
ncbi:MAG: tetratricopeptide repeat protein [Candidatus Poribacteria bacterium]|nr:tetratricopeptide repeat protein [Candidatus Poribacteria bacterium]